MTALFEWLPEYCIDHAAIDAQHKSIFRICSELDAIRKSETQADAEQVKKLTLDLLSQSASHFSYEESVCESHGVPDIEAHRAQHREFHSRVSGIYVRAMQGKIDLNELIDFLNGWFYSHIIHSDMKIKDYM